MSNLNTSTTAQVIENDQQAMNAAYQVADFALVERNIRDQQRILPVDVIQQLSQKGLNGIRIAKQYGGAQVSVKTLVHIFRILTKADASVGQIPQNQFGLLNAIDHIANEQQKQFIYSEILKGKRLANGGPERTTKDTTTVATRLDLINGQYVLNGEKFYSTGSYFADYLAIRAVHSEGYIVLTIIDAKANGVDIKDDWDGFGQRTTASGTVTLKNVVVNPELILKEDVLANPTKYRGAFSQIIQVAIDVGIAEAAFADTLSTIHKARPIVDANVDKASFEAFTLQEVGKLNVLLDAAILLLDEAAEYLDELDAQNLNSDVKVNAEQASRASIIVAEAKVYANDAALNISEKLIELGGSRSSLAVHNLDQHWRNARVHTLHDPVRWKLFAIGNYYLNGEQKHRHAWI